MTGSAGDLQQRLRDAIPGTDGSGCPPAGEYWSAAAGELPFERVRALVDHGVRCAECAEAWRILADVRRAQDLSATGDPPTIPPPVPHAGAPRRTRLRALLPLVGVALAAAGVWLVLRPPTPRPPPVVRGNGGIPAVRAESPEVQPAAGAVLRWSEVPGASSYNVTVLTPELVVVHRALGVAGRELRLPDTVGARAAGGGLLWNVDAVLSDGRTVASPTFELRLREP